MKGKFKSTPAFRIKNARCIVKNFLATHLIFLLRMSVIRWIDIFKSTAKFSAKDVRCNMEAPVLYMKFFLKVMQPFDEKMSVVGWRENFYPSPPNPENFVRCNMEGPDLYMPKISQNDATFWLKNVRCKVEGDFSHDIPSFPVSMSVGARISDSVKIY